MKEVGVLESGNLNIAVVVTLVLLEFLGLYAAWSLWIGVFSELTAYTTIVFVILAIVYLYLFQSDRSCIIRKAMDMQLGDLKKAYLGLDDHQIVEKKALEDIFNRVAISQNIHPWASPTYEIKIQTTIDLNGSKRYTAYRDLQRQMRIDVIFSLSSMDAEKVLALLNMDF